MKKLFNLSLILLVNAIAGTALAQSLCIQIFSNSSQRTLKDQIIETAPYPASIELQALVVKQGFFSSDRLPVFLNRDANGKTKLVDLNTKNSRPLALFEGPSYLGSRTFLDFLVRRSGQKVVYYVNKELKFVVEDLESGTSVASFDVLSEFAKSKIPGSFEGSRIDRIALHETSNGELKAFIRYFPFYAGYMVHSFATGESQIMQRATGLDLSTAKTGRILVLSTSSPTFKIEELFPNGEDYVFINKKGPVPVSSSYLGMNAKTITLPSGRHAVVFNSLEGFVFFMTDQDRPSVQILKMPRKQWTLHWPILGFIEMPDGQLKIISQTSHEIWDPETRTSNSKPMLAIIDSSSHIEEIPVPGLARRDSATRMKIAMTKLPEMFPVSNTDGSPHLLFGLVDDSVGTVKDSKISIVEIATKVNRSVDVSQYGIVEIKSVSKLKQGLFLVAGLNKDSKVVLFTISLDQAQNTMQTDSL